LSNIEGRVRIGCGRSVDGAGDAVGEAAGDAPAAAGRSAGLTKPAC
jgi:hypothetical protein